MFFKNFLIRNFILLKIKDCIRNYIKERKEQNIFFEDNSDFVQNLKLIISYNSKLKKKIKFLKTKSKNSTKNNKKQILRGKILNLNYKFYLSFPLLVLQRMFLAKQVKNKILYFKDWSSFKYFLKSKELLISYIKNIFKSFYICQIPFKENNYKILHKKIINFKLNKSIIKKIFIKIK